MKVKEPSFTGKIGTNWVAVPKGVMARKIFFYQCLWVREAILQEKCSFFNIVQKAFESIEQC